MSEFQVLLFTFLGGIGIFLFSVKYMGDGLQKTAGDGLRGLLDKYTTNPFMGLLSGIVVTILLQSSTATTVLTIGLVNAGFMTLRQAIGVIMGANIGTTTTAFIIGLPIKEYALPIMAIGAFLLFFFKKKRITAIGQVIFGFGGLFYGLNLMGQSLRPLAGWEPFVDFTARMSDNPLLGVVVGVILAVALQSSTAAIGLVQQLYEQGAMDLAAALPVLIGDNIGTTLTAVLVAIGATVSARRAALTHVVFNLIGAILVMSVFPFFVMFIDFLGNQFSLSNTLQIAAAHGVYNVANVIIQFPLIGVLAYIVTKLVPGQELDLDYKPKHLDPIFIGSSPAIALGQAKQEVIHMADYSKKALKQAIKYMETGEKKDADLALQYELAINNLDKEITDYLIKVSSRSLSASDSNLHSTLLNAVRDIERIGDHMENIVELKDYQKANKVSLSDIALKDLNEMFELTYSTLEEAMESLERDDLDKANDVLKHEELIDKMERKLRKQHIKRMNDGECSGAAGIIFVDIVSNLERIGDHSVNIAEAVIDEQ
ncbi:Na/Pi cotransporter family protein [Shouchella lehensis]|uniref:Sodium-dependent phosphate transporter n=1 Tax=Shouchella lehensis G1 TaxID=1246626 RepID=A0A060M0P1_9BACI|nr:Na/Pi cotransporter family protein [Shouchella lehensis]AIC94098.1 sodium-dependent phosphate transporter [Shouchella lehensis G1]